MPTKPEATEANGRLRPGERVLTPAQAIQFAKNNPIINILNKKTLEVKFGGGWDVVQFNPVQYVDVLTADGPRELAVDGYHRLAVYVNNVDPTQQDKLIDDDITTNYPDFRFTIINSTSSALRNPMIAYPSDPVIMHDGRPMLSPEQFARALITPTEEQPEISTKRRSAHTVALWGQKIGEALSAEYPALLGLTIIGQKIDYTGEPERVFPSATDAQRLLLTAGLASTEETIKQFHLDVARAFVETITFFAENRDPQTGRITEQARNQVAGMLSYPTIREKMSGDHEDSIERNTRYVTDLILQRVFHWITTGPATAEQKITGMRYALSDPRFSLDETIEIIRAESPTKKRDELLSAYNLRQMQKAYLAETGTAKLSWIEEKLIAQAVKMYGTQASIGSIRRNLDAIEHAYASADDVAHRLGSLLERHPNLKRTIEEKIKQLNTLRKRVLNYPHHRDSYVTSLRNTIAEIDRFLSDHMITDTVAGIAPDLTADGGTATIAGRGADASLTDQLQDALAQNATLVADLTAARATIRVQGIQKEADAATIDSLRDQLAAAQRRIADLEGGETGTSDDAAERLPTIRRTQRAVAVEAHVAPTNWNDIILDPSDGSTEWFRNGPDMRKVTVMIDQQAKSLFPEAIQDRWEEVRNLLKIKMPGDTTLTGREGLYQRLTRRFVEIARHLHLDKNDAAFKALSASIYTFAAAEDVPTFEEFGSPMLTALKSYQKSRIPELAPILQLLLFAEPTSVGLIFRDTNASMDRTQLRLLQAAYERYVKAHGSPEDLFAFRIMGKELPPRN